ncbi:MAG: helicase [Thermoguttaceae bacterium]|nr:helicase [Thermoguttaceae bacterium]
MFNYRDVLGPDGLIARRRANYERRDAQLAMAAEVDAAIRDRRSLAIEAGTGVGKSFAYLVPAILHVVEDQVRDFSEDPDGAYFPFDAEGESDAEKTAPDVPAPSPDAAEEYSEDADEPFRVESEESVNADGVTPVEMRRVVVSTHTISLQEQLFEKDIPFLNAILPFEFTAALAKGRSNYVCRRRFHNTAKAASTGTLFETDLQKELTRIANWLDDCRDGSKSELNPTPAGEVWNEICCERGNCLGRNCKYHDECFYIRARKRLETAKLIVVNHALLFSDLAIRGDGNGGSILPNYDVLVFDEAHTMEQVAAEHMGLELTQSSVDYLLTRLYNDRTNKGLLVDEASQFKIGLDREIFIDAEKTVDDCRLRADAFFSDLNDWLDARPGSNGRVMEKNIIPNRLSAGLVSLREQLRRCADSLDDLNRRAEYVSACGRVDAYLLAINSWLEQSQDGFVYWLERASGRKSVRIEMRSAPIDVAPILRAQLFNVVPTVIAASATLTTRTHGSKKSGSRRGQAPPSDEPRAIAAEPDKETPETREAFEFFRSRVGMTGSRARALGSPFNYREQMTLVLAQGLELEGPNREEENERRLFAALQSYIEETEGGVFALFTNASQMRRATDALGRLLARENYPFFSQSDGAPRQRMVQMFKESSRSVLFGVDSFWQGVDVPGSALRNVIIVKFPFLAPEQPLVQARIERVKEQGGNPFRDYQLPTAILKFKQGVGRLIRTKSDVGQVVVLDERVHRKSYGRDFLRALPDCKLRVDVFN